MGFIRVRQTDGPAHEFDIPEASYQRNKSAYEVIDQEPVAAPRAAKHVKARRQISKPKPQAKPRQKASTAPVRQDNPAPPESVITTVAAPAAKKKEK